MKTIATVISIFMATTNFANCQCQCVDGLPRTLCTTLEEAKAYPDFCGTNTSQCPLITRSADLKQYPSELEGAVNCRDIQLFDPASQRYSVQAKACDTIGEAEGNK